MEVGFGEARCQQSSLPDWALPMLQIQSSALSVICVWNSGKMTDGKKFSSITRWRTPSVCRNKGMTGVRHALSVGKKFAGPRQRYVSTWDVAQPWGINEPTPTPMKWGGNGRHFPTPYNGAGLLWTGKKSGEEVEKRAVRSRLRLVDMTGTNTDNS